VSSETVVPNYDETIDEGSFECGSILMAGRPKHPECANGDSLLIPSLLVVPFVPPGLVVRW
jgi:hypothetical protein